MAGRVRKISSNAGYYSRNSAFSFAVDFSELDKMLNDLPKAMGKTVLRNALKKAAVPIHNAVVANAPQGPTGNLKDGVVTSPKKYGRSVKSKNSVFMFVGMDHKTAPHAHLVEHGTVERFHDSGKSVGHMPAKPFFRNAWDATKGQALEILKAEIGTQLIKAARRLRTRAERGTLGKSTVKALLK